MRVLRATSSKRKSRGSNLQVEQMDEKTAPNKVLVKNFLIGISNDYVTERFSLYLLKRF